MKPDLTICGVSELESLLVGRDPPPGTITHIVSLWDPPVQDASRWEIDEHLNLFGRVLPSAPVLALFFDDIANPVEGLTEPGIDHMRQVLSFAREALKDHGDDTHLLVHCRMGISRSTACALAILAHANPEIPARDLVFHILSIRPWVAPNLSLTQFADEILERDDPLLPAVRSLRNGTMSR